MTNPVLADIFRASKGLLDEARAAGVTIGVAESCTGGLLGAAITAMPGSSAVFMGGFLTYSNGLKHRLLGVPTETLDTHGAVSEATARAMAQGALERLGTDMALSVTGVAGPSGGTDEKPVGTVWFGLAVGDTLHAERGFFPGLSRNRVRDHAVIHALAMLRSAVADQAVGGL